MSVLFKAASLEEQMETLQSTGLTLSMGKRRQQTSAMRKALNEMQTEVQDAALQGVTLDTDDSLVTELSNLNQKFEQLLTKLHIKMAALAEDVVPNQDSPQPITDRGRAGGAPTVAQTTVHPTAGVVLSSSPLQDGRVLSQSSNQHPPHRHSSLNGESALHTTLPGGSTSLPAGVESGDVFADASPGAVAPSCCRRCDSGLTAAAFGEASSSPRDAGGDLLIRTYLESMENQQVMCSRAPSCHVVAKHCFENILLSSRCSSFRAIG
ncbi:PREDICTED: uncharacterized protein LOC106809697 [Priapulus caudatus]|uniref:Uncharacterized protein LOC106809697 n=1 Tax=Priapulus caudatus TaxID=37621 RepID=A0ABM1E832_PRICU|nr:PREDICTED: uncharacterized protein LOC106809697 [Priapulus caudatus]